MKYTLRGKIAHQFWFQIPHNFPNVKLDEFIVMPNHIHGIIAIADIDTDNCRGGVSPPSFPESSQKHQKNPPLQKHQKRKLGQIVAYYKYQTTKIINQIDDTPGNRIWQRNYYEHIIRNEQSLQNIRKYIVENPWHWEKDPENPTNIL